MNKFSPLWIASVGLFGTQALFAGDYKLVSGQGIPVCEAYRRNLEPRHDVEPMACERQYAPSIHGFSSPNWKKLDLSSHFELLRKAWVYLQENNDSPQGMKLSDEEIEKDAAANLKGMAAAHLMELYVARLDLVGDGKLHKVLALRQEGCGPVQLSGHITRLFVLDSAGKDIDKTVPQSWNSYYNATIEMYQGQPYLESYTADDNWQTLLTGSGVLTVSRFGRDGGSPVCEVSWAPGMIAQK
jgi:hypothetical protein